MKSITVLDLDKLIKEGAEIQLIDVREPYEAEIANIGAELIPMGTIPQNVDKISKDKKVIVHCRSGKRSGDVIQWLEAHHKFDNLHNLEGGILAWSTLIDPTIGKY